MSKTPMVLDIEMLATRTEPLPDPLIYVKDKYYPCTSYYLRHFLLGEDWIFAQDEREPYATAQPIATDHDGHPHEKLGPGLIIADADCAHWAFLTRVECIDYLIKDMVMDGVYDKIANLHQMVYRSVVDSDVCGSVVSEVEEDNVPSES